jgi:VWFA-related protein
VNVLVRANTALILCAASLLRPQAPPSAPAGDVPLIRSTTRLVQINVIALGRDGRPLTDLTKDDFTVTEAGKPQQIAFFTIDRLESRRESADKLPPNIFSNYSGHGSGVPTSVTAILLDGLNTEWSSQASARRQVVSFLKQIQPEDRIALFSLGASLRVLHDFTTDSRELVAQLNKYAGNASTELGASQAKTVDELKTEMGIDDKAALAMLARAGQMEAQFMTESRVQRTLKAIEAIAEHLAGVPGRKNLVWVSGSFPAWARFDVEESGDAPRREWRSFGDELTRTVRALNQANVAVYPVDARGLMTDPGFSADRAAAPPKTGWTPPNIDTMNELASGSGGRAFYNTNDIQGSVRRAIEDSRITYTLGYYPADTEPDGKYRTIRVKVNRPGATVRHRRGYTPGKDQLPTDKVADVELRQALWSPLDSTAIDMNARVDRVKGSDLLYVVVQIAPANVTIEQANNVWTANLAIAFIQNDSSGKQMSGGRDNMSLRLAKDEYLAILRTGILFRKQFPMPTGAAVLKVAVVDKPTGITGSVTVPLSRVIEQAPRR